MSTKISVRKAHENDVPAMVELWKEFIDFHAERDKFFARSATAHETIAKILGDEIAEMGSCVLVAELKGDIIGYCTLTLSKYPSVYRVTKYGVIGSFAIAGDFRRSGTGKALFRAACEWFSKKNVRRIEVPVAASNEQAMSFWRKMGFSPYLETLCLKM